MTDIRSRLVYALAEFFDRNNITVGTAHPALAAETLLSLPGIAIVDLGNPQSRAAAMLVIASAIEDDLGKK